MQTVRSALYRLGEVPIETLNLLRQRARPKTMRDEMDELYELCTPEQWDVITGYGLLPRVEKAAIGEIGDLKYKLRQVRGESCIEVQHSNAIGYLGLSYLDPNCGDPKQVLSKGEGAACYLLGVDDGGV